MRHEAAQAFAKALRLLDDADGVGPDKAPSVVIHTACYAMYHAARACLLVHNPDVTTRHERLASALRRTSESPGVAEAALLPRRAYRLRISADYDAAFQPDPALASRVLDGARRFIDLCRTEFGLGPDAAAEEQRRPSS